MKHRIILFVCTGNTCRSPMAEAALRHELKRRRISWYRVQSAGLAAVPGEPINALAQQALREAKIKFSETYTSQQLTEKMIVEAQAVICMTTTQAQSLAVFPNVTSFPALCDKEITDPYGEGIDVYRATLRAIRECLPRIIRLCCPPVEGNKPGE